MTIPPDVELEPAETPTTLAAPPPRAEHETFSGYVNRWWQGVRAGELGSLPIIVGLVVIALVFGLLDDTFFEERNFTNLLLQMAATATIAIGVVFVLLIGEIDLSVAFVSALGGVVTALLLRPGDPGWPWWVVVPVALALTTTIGFLHAIVITKAGVPSFVVTLAGLLIWNGVVLYLTRQARSGSRTTPSSGSPTTSSARRGVGRSPRSSWSPTPPPRCRVPAPVAPAGSTPSRPRCSSFRWPAWRW
jgi:ABC-type xylose transport system permease subunit